MTGVVEEIETDAKTFLHVKVVFRQFAHAKWNEKVSRFASKQTSVNALLKATRK